MSALFHRDGGCHHPPALSVPIKTIWIDGERVIRCSNGCREGCGRRRRGEGDRNPIGISRSRSRYNKRCKMNRRIRRRSGELRHLQMRTRGAFVHIISKFNLYIPTLPGHVSCAQTLPVVVKEVCEVFFLQRKFNLNLPLKDKTAHLMSGINAIHLNSQT